MTRTGQVGYERPFVRARPPLQQSFADHHARLLETGALHDVAKAYPDKLKELQSLFDAEARDNDVYPLGGGRSPRRAFADRGQTSLRLLRRGQPRSGIDGPRPAQVQRQVLSLHGRYDDPGRLVEDTRTSVIRR